MEFKVSASIRVRLFQENVHQFMAALEKETSEAEQTFTQLIYAKGIIGRIKRLIFLEEQDKVCKLAFERRSAGLVLIKAANLALEHLKNEQLFKACGRLSEIYFDLKEAGNNFEVGSQGQTHYLQLKIWARDLEPILWEKALKSV